MGVWLGGESVGAEEKWANRESGAQRAVVEVEHLSKSYGRFEAVRDVSFSLGPGEIVALLGPNGAGKSTTIKCIVGLLRPTRGQVRIAGHPVRSEAANERLGYIPEHPAVYELLTVWEHMELVARAYRLSGWRDEAEDLLDKYALVDKRGTLASQLSKGMRQKLLIACALLHRPQFFAFDEPIVGLDPQAQRELKEEMLRLRDEGRTILVSTHMLGSVEAVADRAIIMREGKLLGTGSLEELRERYNLPSDTPLEDVFLRATQAGREAAGDHAGVAGSLGQRMPGENGGGPEGHPSTWGASADAGAAEDRSAREAKSR